MGFTVIKHIICELTGYKPGSVDVSQGDRGSRAVSFRLLENGAPWMIPEGATARVAYTLPDGTEGLYDALPDGSPAGEIAGNTVTVELADQIMDQAGMAQVSILVLGPEGGQLATWPIRVMVMANKAARLTVPENMPPYGAGFAGKLFYGGADGTLTPLGLGAGVRVEMMANGAMVLVGEGGGPSEDILTELRALAERVSSVLNSDDATLDQLSEIVAYIKSNKTLIDAIITSKVSVSDIVNNLTTNVANKPLSAAQGVALKTLIDDLSSGKLDADRLPEAVNAALAQAKESGVFDGEDGKTPVKGVDYFTPDEVDAIAEQAAGLVEVPEGGGGSTGWKKIASVEITAEDVSRVYITQDINGKPLNIDKTHKWQVFSANADYSTNGYVDLQLNRDMKSGITASVALRLNTYTGSNNVWFAVEPFVADGQLFVRGIICNSATRNVRQATEIMTTESCFDGNDIYQIGVNLKSSTYFKVGTIISVYEEVSA